MPPERAVHVGDDLLNDVAGAKRAGMRAIWIRELDESEARVNPDVTGADLQGVVEALQTLDKQ